MLLKAGVDAGVGVLRYSSFSFDGFLASSIVTTLRSFCFGFLIMARKIVISALLTLSSLVVLFYPCS